MKFGKAIKSYTMLFIIYGSVYMLAEILYRGYTHITMGIVGGICGILIGLINEITPKMNVVLQATLGAVIVTVIEFIAGYILNVRLDLHIWDYSHLPLNVMGQICLPFSFIWFILCFPTIKLDDWLRDDVLD